MFKLLRTLTPFFSFLALLLILNNCEMLQQEEANDNNNDSEEEIEESVVITSPTGAPATEVKTYTKSTPDLTQQEVEGKIETLLLNRVEDLESTMGAFEDSEFFKDDDKDDDSDDDSDKYDSKDDDSDDGNIFSLIRSEDDEDFVEGMMSLLKELIINPGYLETKNKYQLTYKLNIDKFCEEGEDEDDEDKKDEEDEDKKSSSESDQEDDKKDDLFSDILGDVVEEIEEESKSTEDSTFFLTAIEDDEEDDEDCTQFFSDLKIRTRVTKLPDSGYQIDALVGKDAITPLSITLTADTAIINIYAANIPKILAIFADEKDFVATTDFKGILSLGIKKEKDKHLTAILQTIGELSGGFKLADEFEVNYKIEESELVKLSIDGTTKIIGAALSLAGLSFDFPMAMTIDEEDRPDDDLKNLYLSIEKLLGKFQLDANTDKFYVQGLSLGEKASTLKYGDDTLLSVDATAVKEVDITFNFDFDKEELDLDFPKGFDLQLLFAFKHIKDIIEDLPTPFEDDTFSLSLKGTLPTLKKKEEVPLEVKTGIIKIGSTATGEELEASKGQCVDVNELEDFDNFIELFEVKDSCE